LGASAGRLTRQLLTESAILATAGAVLGLLIAAWGMQALMAIAPSRVPRLAEVRMDLAAIAVTAVLAAVTTVVFGLVPAWQTRRLDTFTWVKQGMPGRRGGASGAGARNVLVSAEVALAMVLLVGAGLLIRSVGELLDVPLGFRTDNLLTSRIWLPRPNDAANGMYLTHERRVEFYRETLRRVSTLPGVEHAAMSTQVPMGGWRAPVFYEVEGRDLADQHVRPVIQQFRVSPSYFAALGIPVVRGRAFSDLDRAGAEPVILISESAARSIWGKDDPLGKRVRFSPQAGWMTVIGVTGDVRNRRLDEPPAPVLYRPLDQSSDFELALLVRARGEVPGLAEALAQEVRAVDPALPLYAVRTMEDLVSGAVAQRRFLMRILMLFGAAAVGLALLGIYGVISYSVSQRTREIGIRMAVGAQQRDVSRMVVRQGVTLTAIGAVAGLAGALALSQLIKSQLFGVQPFDPLTLVSVLIVMGLVAALAAYLPARRAARIDPLLALRRE
jgi:putative ABC transport system permease protein